MLTKFDHVVTERGHGNFNRRKDNNIYPPNQGKGRNMFIHTNRGRGRDNYNQERTNYSCLWA